MNKSLSNYSKTNFDINELLSNTSKQPIVFFGVGFRFSTIESRLIERNISFVVTDNDQEKQGKVLSNTVILSPMEIADKYKDSLVCITVAKEHFYDEVYKQLMEMGFSPEKIVDFKELVYCVEGISLSEIKDIDNAFEDEESREVFAAYCLLDYKMRINGLKRLCRDSREQYFDPDIIKLGNEESFVDAGGFIGDTVQSFIEQSDNHFKLILSFEPSEINIRSYNNNFFSDPRIQVHKCGLGSEKSIVRFNSQGPASSISKDGAEIIQVEKLDDILSGEGVSFIKMDIEGAELDALIGAEWTICNYTPKLAICVYHRDMDIFHITRYLKKCVPNYKLFLRHYSHSDTDTVLYAVVD